MLIDMQNFNEIVVDFIIHTYNESNNVLKNEKKIKTNIKKLKKENDFKNRFKKKQKYENDNKHSIII